MEKDAKEWGNKAQRTSLKALRDIFPQVDVRILKGTVLDHGDDIDAAVEFIITEVLEQPIGGKVDEPHVKEQTSETTKASSGGSLSESHVEEQSPGIVVDDQSNLNARNLSDSQHVEMPGAESKLFDLIVQALNDSQLPTFLRKHGSAPLLSRSPVEPAEVIEAEAEAEAEAVTEAEAAEVDIPVETLQNSTNVEDFSVSRMEVKEESVYPGESLYGSVLELGTDAEYVPAEVGASTLEESWNEEENVLEEHDNSRGSRWAYYSDDDYSDMQEPKSPVLGVPSRQFDSISRYTEEDSRLMESSILEERLDGLFNSSSISLMSGPSQPLSVDVLEELVIDAKSEKEALVAAIEEMRAMRCTVEQAEAAAQQSKKAAVNGGLDVLAKVEEMQVMLDRARQANETHAGEVYGEKAVLGTECQELQRRLAQLKAEKDKAFAAVNEMRATLKARIDRANEEREQADAEKRRKEESARNLLAIEEQLMAKVAQESRNLDAEEEACTKLREFLIARGSIVDSLQGEVAIICEDVEVLKKQLEDGILTAGGSFVQMRSSSNSLHSSLASSRASGGEDGLNVAEAGSGGGSHHSGSSYQSATRTGDVDSQVGELSASELVEEAARMTLFENDGDQAQKPTPFHHRAYSSEDDEGWHLLDSSSAKSNKSSVSSPSSVKRSRSEAFNV